MHTPMHTPLHTGVHRFAHGCAGCACGDSVHLISRVSSRISASQFSSTNRDISSIRLSAIALCGTMAANADHYGLVGILFINLSGRNMELVLQLCSQAFDDHSFFLQAVYPGCPQPESHRCYVHDLSPSTSEKLPRRKCRYSGWFSAASYSSRIVRMFHSRILSVISSYRRIAIKPSFSAWRIAS